MLQVMSKVVTFNNVLHSGCGQVDRVCTPSLPSKKLEGNGKTHFCLKFVFVDEDPQCLFKKSKRLSDDN